MRKSVHSCLVYKIKSFEINLNHFILQISNNFSCKGILKVRTLSPMQSVEKTIDSYYSKVIIREAHGNEDISFRIYWKSWKSNS